MRKVLEKYAKLKDDEGGQVIVEYLIILTLVIGVVVGISVTFRKSIVRIWEVFGKEIAAGCIGCPPDPGVRIR